MLNKCKLLLKRIPSWTWRLVLAIVLAMSLSFNVVQQLLIKKHIVLNDLAVEQIKLQEVQITDLERYEKAYNYLTTTIGLSDEESKIMLDLINTLQ